MNRLQHFAIWTSLLLSPLAYSDCIQSHHVDSKEGALKFSDDGRPATLRILARNEHTADRFSAMESVFPSGYEGPGFHFHEDTVQAFYGRSGKFYVQLKENGKIREILMEPGSFLSIAPGTPHTFRNPFDEEAITLGIDAPGSLVEMFEAMAAISINREMTPSEKEAKLNQVRWHMYDNHPDSEVPQTEASL